MKTMCSPGYYQNGFVRIHAFGAPDVRLNIAGTNEPESTQQAKQGAYYRWS